jgi:L,D-transpeptidase catalytic domain
VLLADRWQAGSVTATDDSGTLIFGPASACGKADGQIASAHGNPARDPKRIDGDHPTGGYRVVRVEHNKPPAHSYGPFFFLLDPIEGDALVAKTNGRTGLAIHGGDPAPDGALRATEGCLRVSNETAAALVRLVEPELAAGRSVEYECTEV